VDRGPLSEYGEPMKPVRNLGNGAETVMEVVGLDPDYHIFFFWGERDSYLLLTTTNNKGTIDKRGNVYFERKERGAWG